ncbi:hypothetical protein THAPSDRAFT_263996, partial [Thalassiosira pseudonana CCMP1335]
MEQIHNEIERYRKSWQRHAARCSDTIGHLQEELEGRNVSIDQFYKFRKEEKQRADGGSVGGGMDVGQVIYPQWKYEADMELGYKATNPNVYKLEPEDLNASCLNEIEDINTIEGAISQMKMNLKLHKDSINQWGSKTGTTEGDIEMFEKKSIKFEEFNLGDRIDFKALENKYLKDNYDGALDPLTPTSARGIIIGSDVAFEDSDIALPVNNCTSTVSICRPLAGLLKEHQVEGVKFCWDKICSELVNAKDESVRGAILAHSMGVGKSIQTVCLLHTLLTHPALSSNHIVQRALLVAPVNTLANWVAEWNKWIGVASGRNCPYIRFYLWDGKSKKEKIILDWYENGGVLVTASGRFTSASEGNDVKKANSDDIICKALFEPGPDIIVLDEAHTMIKSNTTNISKVLNQMKTRLRLSLTGTPLQNNLLEYYRMATWTKPSCLGKEASFIYKYQTPIMDGMSRDCTPTQAAVQEELSQELSGILAGFLHRCDNSVLSKVLPFKQEAIIRVRQSKVQVKLYREFRKYQREQGNSIGFFGQYHALRPVSNHPACLFSSDGKDGSRPNSPKGGDVTSQSKDKSDNADKPNVAPEKYAWVCDKSPDEDTDSGEKWYKSFVDRAEKSEMDIKAIENGGKIIVLLQIIAHCDSIGDKVVVFSQCLKTLSYVEEILQSPNWGGFQPFLPDYNGKQRLGGWEKGKEYLRIDGSVDARERGDLVDTFNTEAIAHSKVFLLSTQAGGLGINLVAANRVVLLDSHWNPAISDQAVHRCYRFGQTKPTFCYRLLAEGSMEEKIYSRAAAKSSLSDLVIDQKHPERSFTRREMDLLQQNDTWVQCDACYVYRMLPPDLPDEEADLPDMWYCKDNKWDPDRSFCEAPEQDSYWYANFWAAQKLSQSQQEGKQATVFDSASPADERRIEQGTQRDVVLQALIARSEGEASGTNGVTSSDQHVTKTWISKIDFSKDTILEHEAEVAKSPVKADKPNALSPTNGKNQAAFKALPTGKLDV